MKRARIGMTKFSLLLCAAALCSCGGSDRRGSSRVPEDRFSFAISRFTIPMSQENPRASMGVALQVVEDLENGTPFQTVADRFSSDAPDAPPSGWIGFIRPEQPDPMTGAIQAILPGRYGGPIMDEKGIHFVYRHEFEEGRALERQSAIPAYGFFLPFRAEPAQDSPAQDSPVEAEKRAKEAWESVSAGTLTLAQAAAKVGMPTQRPDAFIASIPNQPQTADFYRILEKLQPGELAPLTRMPDAFFIGRRGHYYRAHLRHIVIQHTESPDRPLSVSRSKEDARALAEDVLSKLESGALTWEQAVKRHSDDVQSAGLQGWIGAVTNGDLVPEFEAAFLATEPGHISDEVVELEDGFHLLYRVN